MNDLLNYCSIKGDHGFLILGDSDIDVYTYEIKKGNIVQGIGFLLMKENALVHLMTC